MNSKALMIVAAASILTAVIGMFTPLSAEGLLAGAALYLAIINRYKIEEQSNERN